MNKFLYTLLFGLFLLENAALSGDFEFTPCRIRVYGNTLYTTHAGSKNGIGVFDISDPAKPKFLKFEPLGNHPADMEIEGTRLHVTDSCNVLEYDISTPGSLKSVSVREISRDPARGPVSILLRGGSVYLALRHSGASKNGSPVLGQYTRALAVSPGGRVFAAGPAFLTTIEDDPDNTLELPVSQGTPVRIRANGDTLYVALGFHGVMTVRDIERIRSAWRTTRIFRTNTGRFEKPATEPDGGSLWEEASLTAAVTGPLGRFSAYGTFVSDLEFDTAPAKYMFLAAGETGVVVADVSNPMEIRFLSLVPELLWSNCDALLRNGKFLYVHDRTYGLRVLNIRDPMNPKLEGGVPLP